MRSRICSNSFRKDCPETSPRSPLPSRQASARNPDPLPVSDMPSSSRHPGSRAHVRIGAQSDMEHRDAYSSMMWHSRLIDGDNSLTV
jgi:hypothetical protein